MASSMNFPNSTNPTASSNSQMSNPLNDSSPLIIDPDSALCNSEYLTRREVLSRRSRKLHQLTKLYKNHYWALIQQLKNQYGEYCWEYGKSPFVQVDEVENNNNNNINVEFENNDNRNGGDDGENKAGKAMVVTPVFSSRCAVQGCKMKAMPLTQYCNMHILRDDKQVLYKGCGYVIKSSQAGPILCSKPILRTAVPSLCTPHMQKAEKDVSRALKKAGLSAHSSSKFAAQFHVIVAEYVNQIQAKRKEAREVKKEPCEVNEEDDISV
ncbi:KAT8 regulatory NSL complex subunit 2 [Heracleum sosnowskyi]|uniref:KAT8 regulatory NSL complex subunit 2 n=1 Tax=Heracleum sosnowskyi TaxID=360622 RepID=A0AAD8N1V6_9APIA|nr:KAT8 regulatory NSL complex subunit 2 [Heracleum sosnowskyi]